MNTSTRPLKFVHRVLYHIVLFGLLFQFFAYPAYAVVEHFPYGAISGSKYYIPFIRPDERLTYADPYESDRLAHKEYTPQRDATAKQSGSEQGTAVETEMILEMHSAESLGIIGYNNESRSDDPADNLFSFEVDKEELQGRTLRLSYEVYGIENTSGIARSINEHTATGGFFVQKTDAWKEVKETVSIHQLKQGLNHILFTTFENQKLDYKIRNVKLSAFPVATNRLVSLADGNNLYVKEGKAYIKGTVLSNNAQLYINGKHIPVRNNEFETVLENASEIQNLDIRLMQSGRVIYFEDISIEALREVSDVVAYKSAAIMIPVRQDKDGSYGFALADVDLNITKENYENAERITVQKLRDIDVAPVGTNIINVTAGTSAYRFLPDGATFNEPAKLTLRYDEKLLPKGYDGRDVKVLYFDMQQRRWLAVPTDTIIADQHKIVALTDHFTDYIAGVIQAPESPETNAFTPTSISDIQVANPTANIMQMQPPTANQKGDGTLEFPITVPAGRGGMQPNLSVTYNNNGSSGMAGYGWDIELPHISVDTRFGVPEYSPGTETESYLLNGEELVMQNGNDVYLPHRSTAVSRNSSGIRLFFPKTESSFSRIERHGGDPSSYYWVVYDKSGNKYSYGDAQFNSTALRSGTSGPIGKWYLSRTEDKNGNFIAYGIYPEGSTMRLHNILYTLRSDTLTNNTAIYQVLFKYRTQSRPDAHFNYRYGFKETNALWLDSINVHAIIPFQDLPGNPQPKSDHEIKYKFNYSTGKFGKTLLSSIITTNIKNIDENTSESESYTHSFDYYDDLGGGSLFGQEQIISVADDFTDEKHSVLSSTIENVKSSQVNVGGGISPIQNVPAWWPFSFGGTINFAFPSSVSTESSPTMLLLDIDGDGLDDKVMQVGNEIKYRKNLGGLAFSDQLYKAHNIYDLGLSESKTKTDPEMSLSIIAVNLNSSKSETQSRSRMFFSDVNSDGLVDYVKDKIVYFNRMDPNSGLPTFTDNSALTPNLIIKEQDVAPDIAAPLPDFSVGNDLMDVVKVWVAPRNGTIDISGNISKNFVASHNGVRYSVEHSAGVAQPASWNPSYPIKTIDSKIPLAPWDPDDVVVVGPAFPVASYTNSYLISPRLLVDASHATNASTTVTKGDHIYFRVNSSQIPEELVDVTWNPTVSYTDGFPYSSTYNYSFLHGDAVAHPLTISQPGHYRIEWPAGGNIGLIDQLKITVQAYRYEVDAITQQVSKVPVVSNDTIVSTTIIHPFSNLNSYISPNINGMSVDFADPESYIYVEIEVSGRSGIDWKSFDNVFIPVLKKTDSPQTTTYIVPKYDMRANVITAYHPVFYPAPGPPLAINNSFYLSNCAGDPDCDGEYIYFTAWYEDGGIAETTSGLPAKLRYRLHSNGTIAEVRQFDGNSFDTSPVISDPFTDVIVEPGKNLNIEYTTDSYFVASVLNHHQNNFDDLVGGTIGFAGSPAGSMAPAGAPPAGLVRANIVTKNAEELGLGTLYRDWGQFAYKGAAPDEDFTPINKNFVSRAAISGVSNFTKPSDDEILKGNNLMNLDPDDVEFDWDDDTFKTAGTPIPINQGQLDAIKHFTLLVPDRSMNAWKSHERLYVKAWDMSPYLRYNNEDEKRMLPILTPTNLSVYGAVSIVKEHISESKSSGRSVSFYGMGIGDSESRAVSRPLNDFMDINGDGYPDIIGGDKIQLTSKKGGLTSPVSISNSLLFETASNGSGKTLGGSSAHVTSLADPAGRFTRVKIGSFATFSGNIGGGNNTFETFTIPEGVMVDINGDGLVDVVKAENEVEFNNADGFVASTWLGYAEPHVSKTVSNGHSANFGGNFTEFVDPVVIGENFDGASSSNLDLSFGYSGSRSSTHRQQDFVDFNGDGLPDYIQNGNVYFNTGTQHIASGSMALPRLSESSSSAHGFTVNASILIPITIVPLSIIVKVGAGGGKSWGSTYNEDNVSFRDFDGDGYVDLVESASETEVKVRLSRIGRTNMLKTVHNPTGSKITMDYATHNKLSGSGFGSTYKMPFKKWVLSSVEVDDGFAGDGEDVQKYAFEYQNGLKDRRERKFLGFGEVKTHQLNKNDEIYRTVVQEYMLNNMEPSEIYLPGNTSESRQYQYIGNLPTVSSTYDGMQRLLSKTTNEYFIYSIDGNTNYGPYQTIGTQPSITYTDVSRIVPLVARTINNVYHYQGNSTSSFADHQTIAEFRQYDKYGNLTHYYDQVDANTVEITYHDLNTSSQYVVNVPATHKVNIYERYSTTEIDTKGNITAINRHKDGITTGGDVATTNLEYDALGNLTKVILPKPQMSSGQSERMFYEYTYDDLFKLFVTEVNDAYGYTSSTSYNHFGMPLMQKDLNNVEFEYIYDAARRVKQLKGPYNTTWTIRNEYKKDTTSGLYYAITQHNIADEITNPSTQQVLYTSSFADGLGRILQTKKQLDTEHDCGGTGYRLAVSGLQMYDEFGRVTESYLGQEELDCGGTLLTALETYTPLTHQVQEKTSVAYDMQDRVLQSHVHGLNATTKYEYGFGPDPTSALPASMEKVTLPEGNISATYKDRKGRVVSTQQTGNGSTLVTTYRYDPLGQLTKVTDAEGEETQYEYDTFGQKVKTIHPSSEISNFTYDLTGKLIASDNPNLGAQSKQIVYNYSFNQLQSIVYPGFVQNGVSYFPHTVTYSYGAPAAPDYGAGRITAITDLTGNKTMKYGALGEVVEETRLLESQSSGDLSFTTQYRYDSWGRMMELTYPDGEEVVYGYNSVGQLISIISNDDGQEYLTDVQYNFFDQPVRIEYGNEVVTINEYDITQRIRAMQLDRPDTSTFMRNVYSYDRNQNITGISNAYSQHSVLQLGGISDKTYTYDQFNRLKTASGNWQGGLNEAHNYTLNMAYNKTHGIVNKNQYHNVQSPAFSGQSEHSYDAAYKYQDATHPHAVSQIVYGSIGGTQNATASFTYDLNGNMTLYQTDFGGFDDREMIWDEQNRLLAVVDDQTNVSHYVYDHSGERTFKAVGTTSTINIGGAQIYSVTNFDDYVLYPSGYVVVDPGKNEYSKHYYINGKRFVSRLEQGASQFVAAAPPPSPYSTYGNDSTEKNGLDINALMGSQYTTFGINIGNNEQDCEDQMTDIIASYTAANNPPSHSVQHCIDYFQGLVDDANDPNKDYDFCDALKDANKYICDPIDLDDPGNDPEDTSDPDYTEEEKEKFDCLTELNILVAQYAAAVAQQTTQQMMELLSIPDCGRFPAGHCCQHYMQTGIWDCPDCPEMTVEDCNLGHSLNPNEEWITCMEECYYESEAPHYGAGCLDHFLETGEWGIDCMYWTVECDCNEFLDVVPAPDPEVITCLRSCAVEGIGDALEYYDTTGNWKEEYNHFIDDCECGEDDPGPGITPIDRDMRDCALNCSDTNAFGCWEHFHITGEWLPGCKETMRDCGCYDPDDQHDCYRKALNYIKNELILEPYNNSCEVLEYVRTHFKCIPLPLDPEEPEIEDELPDDWDDGGGNDSDPGATDGPYDEYQRKPIWWYHSDHLGSSTYLTDNFGRPSHYYETLPFGEMIVEHNQSTYYKSPYPTTNTGDYDNAYKFNGKELDAATGMYYYGARYYDPRISIFVSVDPLAEKYRGIGGYVYVANNPINLVDPDGMKIVNADRKRAAAYQSRYDNYKKSSDYQKYASLSRREARKQFGKQGLSSWEKVQDINRNYQDKISTYNDRADKTDAIIAKWKTTSPNLYKKVDEMKVDFYLGVDEGVSSGQHGKAFGATGGPTYTQFNDKFNYRVGDLNIRNALPVFINSGVNIDSIDEETGEFSLNHEAGHFIFAVENPALYIQDKKTIGSESYDGGHHPDANTGKAAREYGRKIDIE